MIRLLRDVSLRAKITISFVLIVLFGTAISTIIGSRIITKAMLNEALKQVRHGLAAAEMVYNERMAEVQRSVISAADSERLVTAAGQEATPRIRAILSALCEERQLDFLAFRDQRTGSIARASMPATATDQPPGSPLTALLEEAAAGSRVVSTEILPSDALRRENPDLARRGSLRITVAPPAHAESPATLDSGLALIAAEPVTSKSGLMGVLYGGVLLNRNVAIVDRINHLVFGGGETDGKAGGSVSIFLGDIRVSTTADRDSPTRVEGTRVSAEVSRTVLQDGTQWSGREYVENEWQLAACKPIRNRAGRIVGLLYVGIRERPFLEVRTDMMLTFLVVAAVGVIVVLGLTYLITRSMIHPLEEMVDASNRIAAGDLDRTVSITSRDEIGHLAGSFNKMVASLKTMKLELEEWGRTLEEKVKKRTEELVYVQNQMAQSAKLASLGRLAAGVAHEINNPLGGILAFSSLALEECEEGHPLRQHMEVVVRQTLRCRETVKGLLDFARQSAAQASPTDVNAVVDKTLSLLQNQSIFQNIRIVKKYAANLPEALIDPGQLQQVVVNIALNAVDAMEENGILTVETAADGPSQEVLLRLSDTGKGIPEDVMPLIFEPFFTTKKVGHGTGLGLSIVHGIVIRAGGKIEVESTPGGATFTIRIPILDQQAAENGGRIGDRPIGASSSSDGPR